MAWLPWEREMKHAFSISDQILAVFVGAALLLDVPASRVYYEHTAPTEMVGRYFFHGIKELFDIPIPFTPFEIGSYLILGFILATKGWQPARYWRSLVFLAFLVPGVCAFATVWGLLRGNTLDLAFTQLHFIPLLSAWLCIGYYVGTRPHLLGRVVRILFVVCLIRAVYALYVFLVVFGRTLGDREYLIDHTVSIFLAGGMAYAASQMWYQRHSTRRVLTYGGAFLLIAFPYLLNDRRASFAGAIAALLLLPWILPQRLRKTVLKPYKWGLVLGVALVSFLAVRSSNPHSLIGALRTVATVETQLSYRDMENYNLMVGMIDQPLLGLGFGTRFPTVISLPDISFAFELFDAIPHNTVYFLWTFGGALGIAALTTLSSGLLMVISRVGRLAIRKSELLISLLALVITCQWLMYVFFDMGLLESRSLMILGLFAGGVFPLYARLIVEHRYASQQGTELVQKTRVTRST